MTYTRRRAFMPWSTSPLAIRHNKYFFTKVFFGVYSLMKDVHVACSNVPSRWGGPGYINLEFLDPAPEQKNASTFLKLSPRWFREQEKRIAVFPSEF